MFTSSCVRTPRLTQTTNAMSDDFEVSIFLTELSSRHSVLTKQKIFKDKARIQSNSGKLTNWLTTGTSDQPVLINENAAEAIVIREEEDEEAVNLADIPEAGNARKPELDATIDGSDSDDLGLFVANGPAKRTRLEAGLDENDEPDQEDKKKLGLNTSYDGFSIYGRILCLVVKRRGARRAIGGAGAPTSSQQMLENWVSTQAAADQMDDDEDLG